jgi:hypothetical protein
MRSLRGELMSGFQMRRLGLVMEPEPADPSGAKGSLQIDVQSQTGIRDRLPISIAGGSLPM